jgi:hypothetical protein
MVEGELHALAGDRPGGGAARGGPGRSGRGRGAAGGALAGGIARSSSGGSKLFSRFEAEVGAVWGKRGWQGRQQARG